jgi:hypothetical protein
MDERYLDHNELRVLARMLIYRILSIYRWKMTCHVCLSLAFEKPEPYPPGPLGISVVNTVIRFVGGCFSANPQRWIFGIATVLSLGLTDVNESL